jgi:predicted ester cyclase
MMSQAEQANKAVVRRLVADVLNSGRLEVIDELYTPELAPAARRWITPFRASFPDVHMEVVELIAEGDKVVGRFTCSATHLGEWLGHAPTGIGHPITRRLPAPATSSSGSAQPAP